MYELDVKEVNEDCVVFFTFDPDGRGQPQLLRPARLVQLGHRGAEPDGSPIRPTAESHDHPNCLCGQRFARRRMQQSYCVQPAGIGSSGSFHPCILASLCSPLPSGCDE